MYLCPLIAENINTHIYPRGGKLLKNFFDCKDEKITEKAFSQSLIISVIGILLCLVVLCSMTYAWFANETASNRNTLISGTFDVTISVAKVDNGALTASGVAVEPDPDNEGKYICNLGPGTYMVSLELTGESTVKGHCVVTLGKDTPKHTAAIVGANTVNAENEKVTETFTFTITVVQDTKVTFEPRWGTVEVPDIQHEGAYPDSKVDGDGGAEQDTAVETN